MRTLTFTASGAANLRYTFKASSSTWQSGRAHQGQYSSNGGTSNPQWQVGVMKFAGLRDTDWHGKVIRAARLQLTFLGGGSESHRKKLGIYCGAHASVTGHTGTQMMGEQIAANLLTSTVAYNTYETIALPESGVAVLAEFLHGASDADTLCIFRNESDDENFNPRRSGSYTYNYLSVGSAELQVDIDEGSTFVMSEHAITLGNTCGITIEPASPSATHVLTFTLTEPGGETQTGTAELAAGVTAYSFDPAALFGSAIGSGAVTLTTYLDGESIGSASDTYTVDPVPVGSGAVFVGAAAKARTCAHIYVGVGGVARKVKAAYVGVDGIARQVFTDNE